MTIGRYTVLISAFTVATVIGAIPGGADDFLPSRSNFDRYSAMLENSPFAIATAVALPVAAPNFAKDLYVANAAHLPEGDMVTIASMSDKSFKKYLTTAEGQDGYDIVSIEWSDLVGATRVTISKDGESATLSFNQAVLSQRASANVPPAAVPTPQSIPVMPSLDPVQARRSGMTKPMPAAAADTVAPPDSVPIAPADLESPQIKAARQRLEDEQLEAQRKRKADSERQ